MFGVCCVLCCMRLVFAVCGLLLVGLSCVVVVCCLLLFVGKC